MAPDTSAVFHAVAREERGLITVGPFRQKTGFADVRSSFTLDTEPYELSL